MGTRLLLALALVWLIPGAVFAAADVSLQSSDITFSNAKPYAGEIIRIYATVRNLGQQDVRGSVRFTVEERGIGTDQPFSAVAGGTDVVFVDWEPSEGYYAVAAELINLDPADGNAENNRATIKNFLIDKDTDGDGTPDTADWDDDNDGINDGIETTNGTNPLRADTDGDGVNDKDDAFPLDPTRSSIPKETPSPAEPPHEEPPSILTETVALEASSPVLPNEEQREFNIEEVTYTFPEESEATHTLEVQIARSRFGWHTWQFEALGGTPNFIYLWDFGDGKLSQSQDPLHSFPGAGTYAVTLTVSDESGGLGTATAAVEIGFWHVGNPWLKGLLGLLGTLGATLAVLAAWNRLPAIKKE